MEKHGEQEFNKNGAVMVMEEVKYVGYQNKRAKVMSSLEKMEELCEALGMDESRDTLVQARSKMAEHKFAVGIMGEFKRGKSTVINSLLEKEIMPADILPCTATMNRVTYAMTPKAEVVMKDGTVKVVEVEDLKDYVTKITAENEKSAAEIEEAIVYYPCRFCQNGVDIVDTPGLNDDERMNKVTEEVIPKLDAVIMVITHDSPFSMSEAEFVRNKVMASDVGRMIFLINKMDSVRRAADKERIVNEIRERIKSEVLGKMKEIYGEDSEEYAAARQKMASIKVFPFSALDALDGKIEGDAELVKKSGTLEFEAALTKMLTEERGAIELGGPITLMMRTSEDVVKLAATRREALKLSSEDFEEKQKAVVKEIEEIREKKKAEKRRLMASGTNVKTELANEMSAVYDTLKERIIKAVDRVSVDLSTLSTEAGQQAAVEKYQKAISAEMKTAMSNIAEKTETKLSEIIGREGIKIGEFVSASAKGLTDKLSGLSVTSGSGSLKDMGLDAMVTFMGANYLNTMIPGLGGLIQGYKIAGIKGALAGGISSAIVSTAVMAFAASTLGVVGLPLAAIGGLASVLTGKSITSLLFKNDKNQQTLDTIKKNVLRACENMIAEMKVSRELERWIEGRVETSYNELIVAMEKECDKLVNETQKTIDAIRDELSANEARRKTLDEKYADIIEDTKSILEGLKPTADEVFSVLAEA